MDIGRFPFGLSVVFDLHTLDIESIVDYTDHKLVFVALALQDQQIVDIGLENSKLP